MPARYVNIDRATPMLLPVDLRDWVPENHLVHFIVETVDSLDTSAFQRNERGSGSAQYPPSMMLALLIYCYATGRFSSREIERASHDDVAVRYLCANHHPDHDTICDFRRANLRAFEALFVRVLEVAVQSRVLRKVGTICVDGTKIHANASKHSAVSYAHAQQQVATLEAEVQTLTAAAEQADCSATAPKVDLPAEIAQRQQRRAKIMEAMAEIEDRERARREHERKQAQAKAPSPSQEHPDQDNLSNPPPPPPVLQVPDKAQYNFTDPDSRIMKAGNGQHFEQCYNAQAAVEVESMLIVGQHLTNAPTDREQLPVSLESIAPAGFTPERVVADAGYYSEKAIEIVEAKGVEVLVAVEKQRHGVSVRQILDQTPPPPQPPPEASRKQIMRYRLSQAPGAFFYRLRKQTIEPVFGIIKHCLGFRQFLLRGKAKVALEWKLVCTAYNVRRLHKLLASRQVEADLNQAAIS